MFHQFLSTFIVSCHQTFAGTHMSKKISYKENFIYGEGIKLHYLDWGGKGEPLILIHGLGDSPYIFEDIAESLNKNFRVIAYSRRGHCKSEASEKVYDTPAQVSDLKLLVDHLQLEKVNLLGWSMGGNEITEFAIRFPDRTHKLIYFEAGYDLSEKPFEAILNDLPKAFLADSSKLVSFDSYRNWYHNFWFPDIEWNSSLEKNLLASTHINANGSIIPIPNDDIFKMTLKSAMSYHRNYSKVQAPALALFTNYFFCAPADDTATTAIYSKLEKDIISPWRNESINRIKKELKNSKVKIVANGSHASFIFSGKDSIVESINDFLLD